MPVHSSEQWQRIRSQGRTRFIVTRGILGRGLPMAIVCATLIELYLGGSFPEALRSSGFLGRLLLGLVFFSLGGVMTARANWDIHERRHAQKA